jgi:putative oxidoreductase
MKIGRLIVRVVIGGLMFGHGVQKWFGWFGGPGIEGASGMMHSLGLRPGRRNAVAASASEAIGGALLLAGFLTPAAATVLIATQLTAIRKVHFQNGVWITGGGYEYNLVLIAAMLALVDDGPGKPSLDDAFGIRASGPAWTAASLAAAVVGSTLAIEAGSRQGELSSEVVGETAIPGTSPAAAETDGQAPTTETPATS